MESSLKGTNFKMDGFEKKAGGFDRSEGDALREQFAELRSKVGRKRALTDCSAECKENLKMCERHIESGGAASESGYLIQETKDSLARARDCYEAATRD
jgi:hypothetical protein